MTGTFHPSATSLSSLPYCCSPWAMSKVLLLQEALPAHSRPLSGGSPSLSSSSLGWVPRRTLACHLLLPGACGVYLFLFSELRSSPGGRQPGPLAPAQLVISGRLSPRSYLSALLCKLPGWANTPVTEF